MYTAFDLLILGILTDLNCFIMHVFNVIHFSNVELHGICYMGMSEIVCLVLVRPIPLLLLTHLVVEQVLGQRFGGYLLDHQAPLCI